MCERAGPIAGSAAKLLHGAARPAERGRGAHSLLGVGARAGQIAAPLRLDIEAVQAERLGVGAARHGAESVFGSVAVAGELRRLRGEKKRQRLAGSDAIDGSGMQAGSGGIAGADRDQAVRDRLVGTRAAALAPQSADHRGRAQHEADQHPERRQHRQRHQHRTAQNHQRGFDAQALPDDHHVARPVGEPGDAERQRSDNEEEKDCPYHWRIIGCWRWRVRRAPRRRCAGWRRARHCARSPAAPMVRPASWRTAAGWRYL